MCLTAQFIKNYLPAEIVQRAAVDCGQEDTQMLDMMLAAACAMVLGKLAACYALPLSASDGRTLDLTENAAHNNANAPLGTVDYIAFWWVATRVITIVRYELSGRGVITDGTELANQPWYRNYQNLQKEFALLGTCEECSCKALPGLSPATQAAKASVDFCHDGHVWGRSDIREPRITANTTCGEAQCQNNCVL